MKNYIDSFFLLCIFVLLIVCPTQSIFAQKSGDWVSLFDGQTLEGWKVGNNADTFSVKEGKLVVHGDMAHLFYSGPVQNHNFKDFEFRADVKTSEGANSGIYFHTQYQKEGWPSKGYEVQVNNSHSDPRRTASLYGIDDVRKVPAKDGEWFTLYIKVEGNKITIKVDDKILVDYTEPEEVDRGEQVLSSGTFALQGHDPGSKVYYKNIKVKPLEK